MLNKKSFIINNFLTEDQLTYFDNIINNTVDHSYKWKEDSLMMPDDPIILDIEKKLHKLFQVAEGCIETGKMLQRTTEGNGLVYHYDSYRPSGEDVAATYGVAIYLNDNFTGGELHYKFTDHKVNPVRGMLAAHPGTQEYTHGVLNVTSGTRYTLTAFVYKTK